MKKFTANILVLIAGAYAIHAQGTVSLCNYAALTPYIYVRYAPAAGSPILLGGTGAGEPTPTLSNYALETGRGAEWTVALYGAAGDNQPESSMAELTTGLGNGIFATSTLANGIKATANEDLVPGTWYTSLFGTIPGVTYAGGAASVQVVVWYNDGGLITSLSQAESDNVPWGMSSIGNTVTGGPNPTGPPSVATDLPPSIGDFFVGGTPQPVPEPGTAALVVFGGSWLFERLRRKK